MRRGFTILELLVASLLLGMLMTILTMIFSQSSIAWRTGVAGVADLDDVRETVSAVRFQSDNAYPSADGTVRFVRSVFNGRDMRSDRGVGEASEFGSTVVVPSSISGTEDSQSYKSNVACGGGTTEGADNYVVNVMSPGPDRKMDTYDDIWSFPDDPEEWCK